MAYVKFHTDAYADSKLLDAADEGAKHLHLMPWLILFAKIADDDGRLTVNGKAATSKTIARGIPCVTWKQVQGCMAELEELRVLMRDEDGALFFASWGTRNTKGSETPEAWRLRKQAERNRKRGLTPPVTPPTSEGVTRDTERDTAGQVTASRGTVTPQEQEQEQEQESEGPSTADYVTRCVVALNRGMRENPFLASRFREVPASTQVGRVTWQDDAIPLALAEATIRERARAYQPTDRNRQPHGLRYFDAAVREAWEHARQAAVPDIAVRMLTDDTGIERPHRNVNGTWVPVAA